MNPGSTLVWSKIEGTGLDGVLIIPFAREAHLFFSKRTDLCSSRAGGARSLSVPFFSPGRL